MNRLILGMRVFLIALAVAAAGLNVDQLSAQAAKTDPLESMETRGTIGPYRIGLNYTVRRNTELVAAHYFYVSQLKDIPLTGTVRGESVELQGTDGSTFRLHFVGNGSNGSQPLTFYNSIGVRGSWSHGGRDLPVDLRFVHSTQNPGQRLYSQVTSRSDASFEAMVKSAQEAILDGDANTASNYVHFPLRVNATPRPLLIRNPSELKAQWSQIFTRELLVKIRMDVSHEMFVHEGEVMLGDGELWFDERGLVAVNPVLGMKNSDQ
ncbi:MAG: hypothetical protein ACJ71S_15305 [Acidobacteriaceae bacterium]